LTFILAKRKLNIIETSGILSTITITTGCILLCLSNIYIIQENNKYCIINAILYHVGFFLVYLPLAIKYMIAFNFSIMFNNSKKDEILLNNILSKTNFNSIMHIKENIESTDYTNILQIQSSSSFNSNNSTTSENLPQKKLKRKNSLINKIGSRLSLTKTGYFNMILTKVYMTIFFLILIFIIMTIFIVIYSIHIYYSNNNNIQMVNGKYAKKCDVNINIPTIINIVEFSLLFILVINIQTIYNAKYIFTENKFIVYIIVIWIVTGPAMNVKYIIYI